MSEGLQLSAIQQCKSHLIRRVNLGLGFSTRFRNPQRGDQHHGFGGSILFLFCEAWIILPISCVAVAASHTPFGIWTNLCVILGRRHTKNLGKKKRFRAWKKPWHLLRMPQQISRKLSMLSFQLAWFLSTLFHRQLPQPMKFTSQALWYSLKYVQAIVCHTSVLF